jgi:hypothetical protein
VNAVEGFVQVHLNRQKVARNCVNGLCERNDPQLTFVRESQR